ncbi:hypothetical protein [uncultured Mucilaginibacter sp.]|uniref:hypothetical protein n=1 Tax=uncultured Mucilaginibacter sp. TaxID=797541 RepID=UPI0025F3DDC1|nr:hypothetical protein [uncultured Mucilaginibacter sp.]
MKLLTLTALIFLSLDSYGQKDSAAKDIRFKIVEYINGNLYRKRIEAIDTVGLMGKTIDLYFYRKHFYIPYYLPDQFVDRRYKNETIIKSDSNASAVIKKIISFTYDSLSRIVSYSNSGCIICNYLPYSYHFSYNQAGKIKRITSIINTKEKFKIYYDKKGNIQRLDYLMFDKLDTQIIRIN